jgi:integrase
VGDRLVVTASRLCTSWHCPVDLKWPDVDLGAKTLRVNRQLQRIRDGGGLVFAEPKNASRRTVPLTPDYS